MHSLSQSSAERDIQGGVRKRVWEHVASEKH